MGGKLGKAIATMLRHFDDLHDGDEAAGTKAAFEYIKWYVTQEEDEFIIDKNRNINLCFHVYAWRDTYVPGSKGRRKRKGRGSALDLSDSTWVSDEDRLKVDNARRI